MKKPRKSLLRLPLREPNLQKRYEESSLDSDSDWVDYKREKPLKSATQQKRKVLEKRLHIPSYLELCSRNTVVELIKL